MKDYKRLTDRVTAEMLRNTEEESWDSDNIEAQCYIRLAELEDKIERGELISTVQDERSEQEIAFFVKHNAEVRKQIIEIVLDTEITGIKVRNIAGGISMAKAIADALIEAGIGDVKEIKYRVRRAEKALYIACRETAEIIFKDDFDRHAQEYMYGYLKQAEKELSEEKE